jgi:hypothetical protein
LAQAGVLFGEAFEVMQAADAHRAALRSELIDGFDAQVGDTLFGVVVFVVLMAPKSQKQRRQPAHSGTDTDGVANDFHAEPRRVGVGLI